MGGSHTDDEGGGGTASPPCRACAAV